MNDYNTNYQRKLWRTAKTGFIMFAIAAIYFFIRWMITGKMPDR